MGVTSKDNPPVVSSFVVITMTSQMRIEPDMMFFEKTRSDQRVKGER